MKAETEQPRWQESFSTEETGSDELFEENQSVASEAISQLSTRSVKRHHDVKKLLVTIQRLRQENLSLRDALDSSNILDLATLKNKLRGANADLIRLRQTNGELKERIQVLEKKIFDMVTAERSKSENVPLVNDLKPASFLSVKEKLKFLKRSQIAKESAQAVEEPNVKVNSNIISEEHSTYANGQDSYIVDLIPSGYNSLVTLQPPSSMGTISYKHYVAMYNKGRHFERLARSLERRMEVLQNDNSKPNTNNGMLNHVKFSKRSKSLEFAEAKDDNEDSLLDQVEPKDDNEGSSLDQIETSASRFKYDTTPNAKVVSEMKSKDANTIRELAAEVKRLTTLVSRSMIDEDESLLSAKAQERKSSVDSVQDNTVKKESSTAPETSVMIVHGFSYLFVALAFLVGILVVLVPLTIRHPEVSLW